ncbi:SURF1 family protein [Parvularcula sp. LCG005]|uniref:SURF1 family protein n=1 Tax=Parvularcula sp. LCG005 TaxID=3078805 RepID=UPI00294398D8|nr:SURF1 family protein [Parvularcula sp. LCG005]WOI52843.1 SURF1 family protein [Parvularcula sp. LCG005]
MNPFRRPVLSVCVALGVVFLVSLGVWQLYRLSWKLDLIAQTEARVSQSPVSLQTVPLSTTAEIDAARYRPVVLNGSFGAVPSVRVVGTLGGVSGYYVFSTFTLSDPEAEPNAILVNRGFVSMDEATPNGLYGEEGEPVELTGLVRTYETGGGLAGALAPPDDLTKGLFYQRRKASFETYFDQDLPPVYIDRLDHAGRADIPRGGTTRLDFNNRHFSYALTWFGLALTLIGVYIVMLRSNRKRQTD